MMQYESVNAITMLNIMINDNSILIVLSAMVCLICAILRSQ